MLVEPIRDEPAEASPRSSGGVSWLWVLLFLLAAIALGAVVWLMVNPPQAARSGVMPSILYPAA